MTKDREYNVLFLCTGNSARSILAEALLNKAGRGRFHAFSAGSFPKGAVHPSALALIEALGLPTTGLRSKSWDEFAKPDAPQLDFVITVCDNAAGEVCPVWPGMPVTAHWGIPDPAAATGSDAEIAAAFALAARQMRARIDLFLSLPLASIDRMTTQTRLREIQAMAARTDNEGS
jgi:arsenate reductase